MNPNQPAPQQTPQDDTNPVPHEQLAQHEQTAIPAAPTTADLQPQQLQATPEPLGQPPVASQPQQVPVPQMQTENAPQSPKAPRVNTPKRKKLITTAIAVAGGLVVIGGLIAALAFSGVLGGSKSKLMPFKTTGYDILVPADYRFSSSINNSIMLTSGEGKESSNMIFAFSNYNSSHSEVDKTTVKNEIYKSISGEHAFYPDGSRITSLANTKEEVRQYKSIEAKIYRADIIDGENNKAGEFLIAALTNDSLFGIVSLYEYEPYSGLVDRFDTIADSVKSVEMDSPTATPLSSDVFDFSKGL